MQKNRPGSFWDDAISFREQLKAGGSHPFNYFKDWREFTHPSGGGILGAFDAQYLHGPMHPVMIDMAWLAIMGGSQDRD